jgi:4-diphosphocytidyl-2-C-methyl-D-erythritol kinase
MIEFPNAKINLGLKVLRKRTDGYHDIETVFYPVPLFDILEVVENENSETFSEVSGKDPNFPSCEITLNSGRKVRFSSSGLLVDGDISQNICLTACRLFDQHFGLPFSISMHLHKIIPMGAGLGGGSSDAASVLMILNRLSGYKASTEKLLTIAAAIGSDCSFFILNKPAFAEGRGEVLKAVNISLADCRLVIVKPSQNIATAGAFSEIMPIDLPGEIVRITNQSIEKWQAGLVNDFETFVMKKIPEVSEIKSRLLAAGALFASISGSGSSVFGIFNSKVPGESEFPGSFYFSAVLN